MKEKAPLDPGEVAFEFYIPNVTMLKENVIEV